MLTTNAPKRLWQTLLGMVLCGLSVVVNAQDLQRSVSQIDEKTIRSQGRPSIGAPQVLEIPPVQKAAPAPDYAPTIDEPPSAVGMSQNQPPRPDPDQSLAATRRSYLGLLYVSGDNDEDGVVVIDVIAGSPAARAGFVGEKTEVPSTRTEQVMKVAMAALVMSPAAPAIVPLALAHEIFMTCRPRGDIIIAIGDRLVRDSQDFNDEMRQYQPGQEVTFSVRRCGKPTQISVQLEEEPVDYLSDEAREMREPPPSAPLPLNRGGALPGTSFLP